MPASATRPFGAAARLTALLPILALAGLHTAPTAQAAGSGARAGEINIIASHSGQCVQVENSGLSVGATIVQTECAGQPGVLWRLQESASGGGAFNIFNPNSGKCIEVQGDTVGAPVRQADCSGLPNASFKVVDRASHVWLQPLSAGPAKCLEVDSGSYANGAALRLAECSGQSGTGFRQRQPKPGNDPAGDFLGVDRVNVTSDEVQTTETGFAADEAAVSGNGRYVAFTADANGLVPGDANNQTDVFVRDRQSGLTERVSVSTGGAAGDKESTAPSISADGRYVAFESEASNLVPGDTNLVSDVFVRDRRTGVTERVSVSATGQQSSGGMSTTPSLSPDGRHVAFSSAASNLISGDTNGMSDVFLRDRQTGAVERVSVTDGGAQGDQSSAKPAVSADGKYIAFTSAANLITGLSNTNRRIQIFVRDRYAGTTDLISASTGGTFAEQHTSAQPSISADGRYVTFHSPADNLVTGDTNNAQDVFLRDRNTGATQRISVNADGSQSTAGSGGASISADGRHIAFNSGSDAMTPHDTNGVTDVFVRDRQTGATVRAGVDDNGVQANGPSYGAHISGDGRHVVFRSDATNLVTGDTNNAEDFFSRPRP